MFVTSCVPVCSVKPFRRVHRLAQATRFVTLPPARSPPSSHQAIRLAQAPRLVNSLRLGLRPHIVWLHDLLVVSVSSSQSARSIGQLPLVVRLAPVVRFVYFDRLDQALRLVSTASLLQEFVSSPDTARSLTAFLQPLRLALATHLVIPTGSLIFFASSASTARSFLASRHAPRLPTVLPPHPPTPRHSGRGSALSDWLPPDCLAFSLW